VEVLAFSPLFGKRGVGGDSITKTTHLISMIYCFSKSPSIPLFLRGRPKAKYFHSI